MRLGSCTPRATAPDTGSLRGDLHAAVRQSADLQLENAHIGAGLASRLRESEELALLIREHSVEAVRRRFLTILDRAVARGELPADAAVSHLFADVAPSVIHMRVLLSIEPVDDAFVTELVDRILLPDRRAEVTPVRREDNSEEHLGTVLIHA